MIINGCYVFLAALSLVAAMVCSKSADQEQSSFWKAFSLGWAFWFVLLFLILILGGLGVEIVW